MRRSLLRALAIGWVVFDFLTPDCIGVFQADAQSAGSGYAGFNGGQPAPGDAFPYQKQDMPPQDVMIIGPLMGGARLSPNADGSMPVRQQPAGQGSGGTAFTLGTGSATIVLPPSPRRVSVTIGNNNATAANFAVCRFGWTVASSTNGFPVAATTTVVIPFPPPDQLSCIAAAGTPSVYVYEAE